MNFLLEGLKERVYDKDEVSYIENCRRILDIKCHANKIKEQGSVRISGLQFKTFKEVAVFFEPNIDTCLDPDELRIQWRAYNSALERTVMDKKMGLANMTNIDILRNLINPKMELYRGIADVISVLIRAAVAKGGVESVVESMVSVVEAHTPSSRGILNQERLEDEVMVAWNGEDVVHCDFLVKEALLSFTSQYKMTGHRDGHFVRKKNKNLILCNLRGC